MKNRKQISINQKQSESKIQVTTLVSSINTIILFIYIIFYLNCHFAQLGNRSSILCAFVCIVIRAMVPLISLRLGFRRHFLSVSSMQIQIENFFGMLDYKIQTENVFGILISTRLLFCTYDELLLCHTHSGAHPARTPLKLEKI